MNVWRSLRLKDFCIDAGQYGLGISSEAYLESGVRLLRTTDISSGVMTSNGMGVFVEFVPEERFALRGGDLLLSRSGTPPGQSYLVRAEDEGMTFAGYLIRFRPRSDVDPRFLAYVARSAEFQHTIQAEAVASTIQNFNAERYANMRLVAPDLVEQRRIADFLDAETGRIDQLVEAQQRVTAKLVERRVAGVAAAVTGAHYLDQRASMLAWSSTLPVHWNEVRVGLVARMGSGHTPSRAHPEWWIDCTIPWITTGEVSQVRDDRREMITETREKISKLGLDNSSAELCSAGTVVLCRTASAGYSAVMGEDMATSQDFVTWTCGPRLDPYYLLWCLRAMRQDLLGRLAMGSTHKTIYVPDLQMLRIPFPALAEQRRIVEEIRDQNLKIDQLADAVKRQIELLAERRQALITAAVTGQLDVTTARPKYDRDL